MGQHVPDRSGKHNIIFRGVAGAFCRSLNVDRGDYRELLVFREIKLFHIPIDMDKMDSSPATGGSVDGYVLEISGADRFCVSHRFFVMDEYFRQ